MRWAAVQNLHLGPLGRAYIAGAQYFAEEARDIILALSHQFCHLPWVLFHAAHVYRGTVPVRITPALEASLVVRLDLTLGNSISEDTYGAQWAGAEVG